ncbi:hypothetical protein EVAR_48594_1 [Eumeta japonica]|uniref:Uncharacterized protein n=1 Tax=Eumeta variegata TaxID=151549 RepID=A0A4C1YVT5_EUMVA|nr:hypothetical protein EVAR_48594_1 [Eumeta japonica]
MHSPPSAPPLASGARGACDLGRRFIARSCRARARGRLGPGGGDYSRASGSAEICRESPQMWLVRYTSR